MKKKLVALIVAACVVVGGSVALISWAIAATNVGLGANLSVTYTASPNVVCDITATYQRTGDSAPIPFESGGISLEYGATGGARTMTASSQSIQLTDSNTYVVFEYKFTNKNKMDTMGITIQPVDNGSVTGKITQKYYFSDLSSMDVSAKESAILGSGIENSALSTYSYTLAQNETICFYMLIEITPGIRGEYLADDSQIFTFNLNAVEVEPSKAISYLSSDWATRVFSTNSEANAVQSIIFTKDASQISGLSNSISVGTNSPTSTDAYIQTNGVEDVKAYYNDKTSIVVYSPGKIYAPQNSTYLFCRGSSYSGVLKSLTTLNLNNFDTSNVTDMSNMFKSCNKLTSLDVGDFDTSNVTNMSEMFSSCSALTSLDLSNFDTRNVTDMSYMFSSCSALTSLDVSNFNTSIVTNMSYMFSSCSALTSLDVSNFNTSNVTGMSWMFGSCNFTSLDVSNFNTSNVTDMSYMFRGCGAITNLNLSNFNTGNVTNISFMFELCRALTSLDVSNFNTSKVTRMTSMFSDCEALTSLDISNFDTSIVTYMSNMFKNCYSLTSLDLSNFNTNNVTDMSSMFSSCLAITNLDLSNFNTSSVTNMSNMFTNCVALTSLDLSNFNTNKVKNMSNMFSSCGALTDLNLSSFDTSNVTNMSSMFYYCEALISIDVSNFDTSKVTDMGSMFYRCNKLTNLNLGNFNLQSCTRFGTMFFRCSALTEIILPYNLKSGYTIDLPASIFYNGEEGPYSKIGTATSGTTVACSTESSKVTLRKK